jgi:hypothetical protein
MRKQTTNEPVQLELEIDGSSLTKHFNDYVNFATSLSHQEFYAMKDDNPSFPLIDHIRRAHLEYVIKENVARKEFRRGLSTYAIVLGSTNPGLRPLLLGEHHA